jgi:hypothetical protein
MHGAIEMLHVCCTAHEQGWVHCTEHANTCTVLHLTFNRTLVMYVSLLTCLACLANILKTPQTYILHLIEHLPVNRPQHAAYVHDPGLCSSRGDDLNTLQK